MQVNHNFIERRCENELMSESDTRPMSTCHVVSVSQVPRNAKKPKQQVGLVCRVNGPHKRLQETMCPCRLVVISPSGCFIHCAEP